jgi:hypothetical protein
LWTLKISCFVLIQGPCHSSVARVSPCGVCVSGGVSGDSLCISICVDIYGEWFWLVHVVAVVMVTGVHGSSECVRE